MIKKQAPVSGAVKPTTEECRYFQMAHEKIKTYEGFELPDQ